MPGKFTQFRVSGAAVRDWAAPAGYYTDTHELLVGTGSRPSYLFGYDFHREDLRFRGAKADSLIAWHTVFSLDAAGNAKPVFVARDHFTSADRINPETRVVDFDHPNSIDVDPVDGNLLVSWRNFDQVTKINPTTGQFVWRLGGKNGQFRFVNDPLNGFSGQHFARRLPNGNLLLFDNGNTHTPKVSRAVEYKIDTVAHTATLVWQFRHTPDIDATFVGSAQRLPNGNTVVGFSYVGLVTEVTPAGSAVWEAQLVVDGKTNLLTYRPLKVPTLGHLRP